MGSIRRHKNAMSALLAEFYDKPNNNLEFGDEFDDYLLNKKRREDEGSAGGMCQSVVRYARPQKAKAASGEWKFIVNTGQHTQTLRLEKCSNPGESCSYLAQTYRSHCAQVYNYHRLLSWDKVRGLHVDIFKVPTCCSCQVDGYRQQFPPLSSIQAKEYSPAGYKVASNVNGNGNSNGYSTINEEDLDYNDESDEDDLGLSYAPYNSRDNNELSYLSSKKVRSKLPAPASHNEPRVDIDLDLSPSETQAGQEVNVFGPTLAGEQPRVPIKRKRIYSSTTHTAATVASEAAGGSARLRIPIHISKSQSTAAATAAAAATAGSLPARTGAAAAVGVGAAAHAHQASAASSATASFNPALGQSKRHNAASKSRPRFYAPAATTPAVAATSSPGSSAAPLPTTYVQQKQQQQQSTALPQPPHVSFTFGDLGISNGNGTRRINYSYHPIIDFFEKNRRAEATTAEVEPQPQPQSEPEVVEVEEDQRLGMGVYQHAMSASHERRMGFGFAATGAAGAGRFGFANDNAWQPLVVAH
ncbi:uncharacterized protein LOC115766938 [Drosophila novamexicana]|uniref:uncharacterized protein LOC115766938 n=1 Tax=Drosophila novamexicana TaxID=47314 RepID=UPI0011E5BDA6|nr:uncharacterized protein LOC115766938 [Drosophila novamexicana]